MALAIVLLLVAALVIVVQEFCPTCSKRLHDNTEKLSTEWLKASPETLDAGINSASDLSDAQLSADPDRSEHESRGANNRS